MIALAQIQSHRGDVVKNTSKHLDYIVQAAGQKAQALFFPELSLTGYEPTLAQSLAFQPDDVRLEIFQEASNQQQITIGLGVPMHANGGVTISMVIFQPNKPKLIYAKQLLHTDEWRYFISGDKQALFTIDNMLVAPAICYESLQPNHAATAVKDGAQLYLASVAKSAIGLAKAYAHYPVIAKQHNMPVVMVNAVGLCDNFACAGGSAVWDKDGRLVEQLGTEEGLLVVRID